MPEEDEEDVMDQFQDAVEDVKGSKSDTTEDDDEILSEIPVYLSSKMENLMVLQYPNKTKRGQVLSSKIKKDSGIVELEMPLDPSKFFDLEKSEEWGGVTTQALSGVLQSNDIYYVGMLKEGKLSLTPLSKTAQLRPSLKYIDETAQSKRLKQAQLNKTDDHRKNEVKVVQMSVKSTVEAQQRLGGALEASKKLEDEHFIKYKWCESEKNDEFLQKLDISNSNVVLESDTTQSEYIDWLFSETKSG